MPKRRVSCSPTDRSHRDTCSRGERDVELTCATALDNGTRSPRKLPRAVVAAARAKAFRAEGARGLLKWMRPNSLARSTSQSGMPSTICLRRTSPELRSFESRHESPPSWAAARAVAPALTSPSIEKLRGARPHTGQCRLTRQRARFSRVKVYARDGRDEAAVVDDVLSRAAGAGVAS